MCIWYLKHARLCRLQMCCQDVNVTTILSNWFYNFCDHRPKSWFKILYSMLVSNSTCAESRYQTYCCWIVARRHLHEKKKEFKQETLTLFLVVHISIETACNGRDKLLFGADFSMRSFSEPPQLHHLRVCHVNLDLVLGGMYYQIYRRLIGRCHIS